MTRETSNSTGRIEWIDLAKGFCIILVVLSHVVNTHPLWVQLSSFRMPLYFVLSGLFFKQYEGFIGFLKRKINKLLIPFLFFLYCTSIIPHKLITHLSSIHDLMVNREVIFNMPIWFLLCLFEINVIFYLVQWIATVFPARFRTAFVVAVSVLIGLVGMALGYHNYAIPLFVDTALSALPLFVFGWWLNRRTTFLRQPVRLSIDVPVIVVCALIVGLFAVPMYWQYNSFTLETMKVAHLCGIAGTVMTLTVARIVKRLPLVSYWGRYSIMILCTHYPIKMLLTYAFRNTLQGAALVLTVFLLTLAICHFLIPVMKRFLPHVTAQKDLIPVG